MNFPQPIWARISSAVSSGLLANGLKLTNNNAHLQKAIQSNKKCMTPENHDLWFETFSLIVSLLFHQGVVYSDILFIAVVGVFEENRNIQFTPFHQKAELYHNLWVWVVLRPYKLTQLS